MNTEHQRGVSHKTTIDTLHTKIADVKISKMLAAIANPTKQKELIIGILNNRVIRAGRWQVSFEQWLRPCKRIYNSSVLDPKCRQQCHSNLQSHTPLANKHIHVFTQTTGQQCTLLSSPLASITESMGLQRLTHLNLECTYHLNIGYQYIRQKYTGLH